MTTSLSFHSGNTDQSQWIGESSLASRLNEGQKLGPYTVVKFIGRGGMGEVYEAYEDRLDRRVALKIISKRSKSSDGQLAERFIDEAKALAQIQHQNVVSIYSIDKIDGYTFIAMEFLEGLPIDVLRKKYVMDFHDAIYLLYQMLEGLKALHDKRIVHRDIKPGNIILQKNGVMKFIDFGLAKDLNSSKDTTNSGFFGTPRYIAPEVAAGEPSHAGSDIFCLGLVFYELFSGERYVDPKGESSAIAILESYSRFRFRVASRVRKLMTNPLYKIISKMLEPKYKERYASVDQVLKDLKPLIEKSRRPGNVFYSNICSPQSNYKETLKYLTKKMLYDNFAAKRIISLALALPRHPNQMAKPEEKAGTIHFKKQQIKSAQLKFEQFFDAEMTIEKGEAPQQEASSPRSHYVRVQRYQSSGSWLKSFVSLGLLFVIVAGFLQSEFGQKLLGSPGSKSLSSLSRGGGKSLRSPLASPQGKLVWIKPGGSIRFNWSEDIGWATSPRLQIARDVNFRNVIHQSQVSNSGSASVRIVNPGHYFWRITDGGNRGIGPYQFWLDSVEAPTSLLPADSAVFKGTRVFGKVKNQYSVSFYWRKKSVARSYILQVSPNQSFHSPLLNEVVKGHSAKRAFSSGRYYWRMKVNSPDVSDSWGEVRSFVIR